VLDGQLLLDQAVLTGASLPVEAGVGATAYAGTTVTRGEATGTVTATGPHTVFGTTAALVRSAKTVSHRETVILTIGTYLVVLDTGLVLALLVYALVTAMPLTEVLPFALILLVASVPVALPATFTLATALGALELARHGVRVTRLAAIAEAAAMDVLASDKPGTLPPNRLALAAVCAYAPSTEDEVLRLAALACDDATQDPFALAMLSAARTRHLLDSLPRRRRCVPFEPATRRSEAVLVQDGAPLRVLKGAPQASAALGQGAPELSADIDRLAATGSRLLAVAVGTDNA
jgi:H+-transporting ATPase